MAFLQWRGHFPGQVLEQERVGSHLFLRLATLSYHKAPPNLEQGFFLRGWRTPVVGGGGRGGRFPLAKREVGSLLKREELLGFVTTEGTQFEWGDGHRNFIFIQLCSLLK